MLRTAEALIVAVAGTTLLLASTCWVIQSVPCVTAGQTCSAEYQGKVYSGTIQANGFNVLKCKQGSPGRLSCFEDGAGQNCVYVCVITVDGRQILVSQSTTFPTPRLAGNSC